MEIKPNNIYLGDCYKLIKEIPDKSVDLVYTDIPYLIADGGTGDSPLAQRISGKQSELGNKSSLEALKRKAEELKVLMDNATNKSDYEKYHSQRGNILNKINLKSANIVNGIDYSLFDELYRVMKYIYIYMV